MESNQIYNMGSSHKYNSEYFHQSPNDWWYQPYVPIDITLYGGDNVQVQDASGGIFKTVQTFLQAYPSDLIFQLSVAFAAGLFFAPWSYGLFYLILFYVIFEVIYMLLHRDFTLDYTMVRLAVVSASFFGWLVGRLIIGDPKPMRKDYRDGCHNIGRPDFEHPTDDKQINKLWLPVTNCQRVHETVDNLLWSVLKSSEY